MECPDPAIFQGVALRFVSLLLAGAMLPSSVLAQDIVVMRKVMTITVPDGGERQQPSAVDGYSWKTFAWQSPAGACGQTVQTRRVECVKGVQTVADGMCGEGRPETSRQLEDLKGCSYDWTLVSKGAWNSECSLTATRPLNYECRRSDGTKVDDGRCGARPPATEKGENVSQCTSWKTGEFGAYDSTCSTSAVRTRQVQCVITDGTVVPDSRCTGEKPATSETSDVTSGCQARWDASEWSSWSSLCGNAARTRTVTCARYGAGGSKYQGSTTEAACTQTRPETRETAVVTSTCTNTIRNGDFESCTGDAWVNGAWTSPPMVGPNNGDPGFGVISGKCSAFLAMNYYSQGYYAMYQDLTLVPGKLYKISFKHKSQDTSPTSRVMTTIYRGFDLYNSKVVEGEVAGSWGGTLLFKSGSSVRVASYLARATDSAGQVGIMNNSQGGIAIDDVSVTEVPE